MQPAFEARVSKRTYMYTHTFIHVDTYRMEVATPPVMRPSNNKQGACNRGVSYVTEVSHRMEVATPPVMRPSNSQ